MKWYFTWYNSVLRWFLVGIRFWSELWGFFQLRIGESFVRIEDSYFFFFFFFFKQGVIFKVLIWVQWLGNMLILVGNFDDLLGISRKTQELYALVFLARYVDIFTEFISVYNTIMKIVFIASTLAIVWCMRGHRVVRRSYDRELDTFRHYFLIAASLVLALLVHEKFTFQEVVHC